MFAAIVTVIVLPESVAPKFTPAHVSFVTATLVAAVPSVDSETSLVSARPELRRHGAEAHAHRIERNVCADRPTCLARPAPIGVLPELPAVKPGG